MQGSSLESLKIIAPVTAIRNPEIYHQSIELSTSQLRDKSIVIKLARCDEDRLSAPPRTPWPPHRPDRCRRHLSVELSVSVSELAAVRAPVRAGATLE